MALDATTTMPQLSGDPATLARGFTGLGAPTPIGSSSLRFEPFWKARTTPYHTYVRFTGSAPAAAR